MKVVDESLAQRGDKGQRATDKHHRAAQFAAVCQGRDGLHRHGAEDGGRDVVP